MKTLVLMTFAVLVAAQTPTIEQSLNLKTAGSPRISPDGRYVAYTVSETNWDENAFETQIWMAMTATGERYQLTHAKKSSSSPRWSPDSKRLAFLSDRDGTQQIFVISPAGGEATQLTRFEGGVSEFQCRLGGPVADQGVGDRQRHAVHRAGARHAEPPPATAPAILHGDEQSGSHRPQKPSHVAQASASMNASLGRLARASNSRAVTGLKRMRSPERKRNGLSDCGR